MIRALLWKEYREHRWTLFGYVAILFLLKIGLCLLAMENVEAGQGNYWQQAVLLLITFPFFALILGASSFSHEEGKKTLPFLMTKPVSRTTVFAIKVGVAFITLIAATLLVSFAANDKIGLGWDEMTIYNFQHNLEFQMAILAFCFGMGILGSQFSKGTLTSSVVGGVTGVVTLLIIIYCDAIEPIIGLLATFGVGAILVASIATPGREVLPLKDRAKNALRAFVVLLGIVYAGLHCWNAWQTTNASPYSFSGITTDHRNGLTVIAYDGVKETFRIRTFVKKDDVLTRWKKDNTVLASWSPNGKSILELDWANHWGTRRTFGVIPRVLDEKGEEIWAGRLGRYETPVCWSKSGNRLAVELSYTKHLFGRTQYAILLCNIQTKEFKEIRSDLIKNRRDFNLLGWHNENELLALVEDVKVSSVQKISPQKAKAKKEIKAAIVALDEKGNQTAMYTPFEGDTYPFFVGRLQNGDFVFSHKPEEGKSELLLWSAKSGKKVIATLDSTFSPKAISSDGRWLLVWNYDVDWIRNESGTRRSAIAMINRWRVQRKLACFDLHDKNTANKLPTPEEKDLLANEDYQRGSSRHNLNTVFWSDHYSGFLYVEGVTNQTRRIVKYDPVKKETTTILKEQELVLP